MSHRIFTSRHTSRTASACGPGAHVPPLGALARGADRGMKPPAPRGRAESRAVAERARRESAQSGVPGRADLRPDRISPVKMDGFTLTHDPRFAAFPRPAAAAALLLGARRDGPGPRSARGGEARKQKYQGSRVLQFDQMVKDPRLTRNAFPLQ